MLKPFPGNETHEEWIFNYHLSRIKRIVANSLGTFWKSIPSLHTEINTEPNKFDHIIIVDCVPHNFLRRHAESSCVPTNSVDTKALPYVTSVIAGNWRQLETMGCLVQHDARNSPEEAKQCCLQYKNYFMNEGHVNWQYRFL
jgi:hypothetical protein